MGGGGITPIGGQQQNGPYPQQNPWTPWGGGGQNFWSGGYPSQQGGGQGYLGPPAQMGGGQNYWTGGAPLQNQMGGIGAAYNRMTGGGPARARGYQGGPHRHFDQQMNKWQWNTGFGGT